MTNGGFVAAAYSLTAIVIVGYLLSLWRRLGQARSEAEKLGPDA